MNTGRILIACCISIVSYIFGTNAIADVITIKNGDLLSGSLVGLSGKIVSFKTDYAGTLYIRQDEVKTLETTDAFTIIYSDESKATIKLTTDVQIEQIDIIRSADSIPLLFTSAWKRQLTISLDGTSGNNESQNFSMYGESTLQRTKTEQVLNLTQTWESTDAVTTTNVLDVKYNFRWLRRNQWYNTMSVDYSYDPSKDISWRSLLGFGGGKKFVDHSLTDFSVDIGLSAVYQELDDIEEITPAMRVASTYNNKLFGGRVQLLQQTRLLWITESNEGVLDGLAGIRFLLANSLNLDFRTLLTYATNPPENNGNFDLTYSLGIGTSF